jgi:ribonuclease HI
LGSKTNNQAEYLALLLGMYYVKKHIVYENPLLILSDSQLLVRQFKGLYKVKHPELRPLYLAAQKMIKGINVDFAHIPREENEQADALANTGIDKKILVMPEIKDWLRSYDIVV